MMKIMMVMIVGACVVYGLIVVSRAPSSIPTTPVGPQPAPTAPSEVPHTEDSSTDLKAAEAAVRMYVEFAKRKDLVAMKKMSAITPPEYFKQRSAYFAANQQPPPADGMATRAKENYEAEIRANYRKVSMSNAHIFQGLDLPIKKVEEVVVKGNFGRVRVLFDSFLGPFDFLLVREDGIWKIFKSSLGETFPL